MTRRPGPYASGYSEHVYSEHVGADSTPNRPASPPPAPGSLIVQDLRVHTAVAQARALEAGRRAEQNAANLDALAARVAELENPTPPVGPEPPAAPAPATEPGPGRHPRGHRMDAGPVAPQRVAVMTHAQPAPPPRDQPDRRRRLAPVAPTAPADPPKPARLELKYDNDTTHDPPPDVDSIVSQWRERGWT